MRIPSATDDAPDDHDFDLTLRIGDELLRDNETLDRDPAPKLELGPGSGTHFPVSATLTLRALRE